MTHNHFFIKTKILIASCFFLFFAGLFANEKEALSQFEIPQCKAIEKTSAKKADDHEVRILPDFVLCYRESYEQPEWVAYHLTKEELVKNAERGDNFRADSSITTGSAQLEDYRGSGYDRGHLAPAADFAFSKEAMSNTFFMSNMSPQTPSFNRGIWSSLENRVRKWAEHFGSVYVITGPVLEKKQYETIGVNKVAVPEFYYKVLCTKNPATDETIMIAFILPNEKSSQPLESFVVSVDELEKRTNIDFFHVLSDDIEQALENKTTASPWF
ncbi:MAG: DNA/RNA non-specific endonuclease [Treponemataceae bacterium]